MTTTPWPKAICFFPSRLVARAGRLAARHDMVTYALGGGVWLPPCLLLVCMRRHTFCSLCKLVGVGAARMFVVFLHLRVVLSRGCVWFPTHVPPVMLGVLRIPPYHFACSRRWLSCCTCGGMHGRAYLSLPFASYVSGRAGGGGVGTSRLRLVVTFYFCWRGCHYYLVFVA